MKSTDNESESIQTYETSLPQFIVSPAGVWHVMTMFDIPDIDLLEQTNNSGTVCLDSNEAESTTITFDVSVAQ